jgi:DNA-binding LacI/PurR family transcriptional regulator
VLARLVEDEVPLVLIGRHPRFPWLRSVSVENTEGARLAVAHHASAAPAPGGSARPRRWGW